MVGRENIGRTVVRCWRRDVHLVLLVKKKKKLGFCENNTINVSTHRLQIRSGTVEEDRFYTVSNLSELLTIDVYALIYSPGAA